MSQCLTFAYLTEIYEEAIILRRTFCGKKNISKQHNPLHIKSKTKQRNPFRKKSQKNTLKTTKRTSQSTPPFLKNAKPKPKFVFC